MSRNEWLGQISALAPDVDYPLARVIAGMLAHSDTEALLILRDGLAQSAAATGAYGLATIGAELKALAGLAHTVAECRRPDGSRADRKPESLKA
jgi:hypothetical protein